MKIWQRVAAVVATTMLASSLTAATSTAHAADCGPWDASNTSSGWGYMYGTHNLKNGPYSACSNLASVPSGTKLYAWCTVWNSYDNLWVYVRVAGTSTSGWTSFSNIYPAYGAFNGC